MFKMRNSPANFSNSSVSHDISCPHTTGVFVTTYILIPIISFIGIIANLFSTVVFFRMLKNIKLDGQMFKYLFFKSLNDLFQFVFQIFSILYFCPGCESRRSYAAIVWFIGFLYYAESVVELCSAWLEILATFDCFCLITNRFKWFTSKRLSNCLIAGIQIYSTLFYIFWLFSFEIIQLPGPIVSYNYYPTSFYFTVLNQYLRYIHTLSRDVIVFVILVLLNFLILLTFKRNVSTKLRLLATVELSNFTNISNWKPKRIVTNAKKAEKRTKIMISLIGLNYLIGHIGPILYYIPFEASATFWSCFEYFQLIPFYVSYLSNILIYYSFNKHFRFYLKESFIYILSLYKK